MPRFIVTTLQGLESALEKELIALGAEEVEVLNRGCAFVGDKEMMYRVNYLSRIAIRVLYPILEFEAQNEAELYESTRQVEWDKFFDLKDTFAIRPVVSSEVFKHSHFAGLKVKDAIADQFRDKYNLRPDVDTENPTLAINLYIKGTNCTLLLNASEESLHMRGWRREQLEAPLNEVLAAGMIQLSGYDGSQVFFDPMCGSGTLAVEACMLAMKIPAQKFRQKFGFQKWKNYDATLWAKVRNEADALQIPLRNPIFAKDIAPRGRNATILNAMGADLEQIIQVEKQDFFYGTAPAESGIMIVNPPYDERMELDNALDFYKKIGDKFKQQYQGWSAWVISAHTDAFKHLGLRPFQKHHLKNGPLECWFRGYELRKGNYVAHNEEIV